LLLKENWQRDNKTRKIAAEIAGKTLDEADEPQWTLKAFMESMKDTLKTHQDNFNASNKIPREFKPLKAETSKPGQGGYNNQNPRANQQRGGTAYKGPRNPYQGKFQRPIGSQEDNWRKANTPTPNQYNNSSGQQQQNAPRPTQNSPTAQQNVARPNYQNATTQQNATRPPANQQKPLSAYFPPKSPNQIYRPPMQTNRPQQQQQGSGRQSTNYRRLLAEMVLAEEKGDASDDEIGTQNFHQASSQQ
jgi:hypothetical protein